MRVFVFGKHKTPLMPCHPARARELLTPGKAVIHKIAPFAIRLKERIDGEIQPLRIKLDPGRGNSLLRNGRDRNNSPCPRSGRTRTPGRPYPGPAYRQEGHSETTAGESETPGRHDHGLGEASSPPCSGPGDQPGAGPGRGDERKEDRRLCPAGGGPGFREFQRPDWGRRGPGDFKDGLSASSEGRRAGDSLGTTNRKESAFLPGAGAEVSNARLG